MPQEDTRFLALISLQRELRQAHDHQTLYDLAFTFLQDQLSASSIKLHKRPVPAEPASSQAPVGRTGYWLQVERSHAFTEEEVATIEMVATLLATAPLFSRPVDRPARQQQLLQAVNEAIANHWRFTAVVRAMAVGFAGAFPGTTGRLYIREKWGNLVQMALAEPVVVTEPDTTTLPGDFNRVLNEGQTVILADYVPPHLIVPIKINEAVEALLYAEYPEEVAIPASDVDTLELLAGYTAIALSNDRLLDQAQQRTDRLETIYQITESARFLKPLSPTLNEIHEQLILAFKAPTSYIALYDSETQRLSFPCIVEYNEQITQEPISILDSRSLAAWVVTNNQPYATDDWLAGERPVDGVMPKKPPRSVICVPMRVGNEVLGAVSIQSDEPGAFDVTDVQTLTAVASHIGVIIKNASLYTTAKDLVAQSTQDYQGAVALRQAIAVISTSLERDAILSHFLLALAGMISYDTAFIFLWWNDVFCFAAGRDYDGGPMSIRPDQAEHLWRDSVLLQEIREKKETICLNQALADPRWLVLERFEQVRAWLGVPLVAGGEVLGVLMIVSKNEGAFAKREEWLASTLASHAAVALQNAQLYEKTQQQLSELSTLYQASATMTANLDQDFVLKAVANEMVRALQVDNCTIYTWDATQQSLLPAVQARSEEGQKAQATGLATIDRLEEYPIVRRVLQTQTVQSLCCDCAPPDQLTLLQAASLCSILLVPLVRRSQLLGLLALGQVSQAHVFSQDELRLAQNLAGQAAVAIEHARLFGQAQRRIEELSTFHEIVLQLNTPLKLSTVLDTISESALKLLDASNLHIYLYDEEIGGFTFGTALWRDGRREPAVPSLRPEGLTATVVRQASPVVINDAHNHPLYQTKEARNWGIYAIAGFPLKQGDQVIGVFTITYLHPHIFTQDELLLLHLLADQAAVAVRNARLFADSQRRLRDMSALVDMAKQVTGNLKLKSVLQTTVQILKGLLNARASTITMLSDEGDELLVVAAAGVNPEYVPVARMKVGEGISGEVVRHGELIYIRDAHAEPNFLFFDEIVRSLLVVPLMIRDEAVGTLTVDSDQPNAFGKLDIQLMTIAAAQVSIAIANARLFEELEERAAELVVAYEELKESDRLKDELVQNVSHELRTPLTFVKGYVDLLMEGEMGLVAPEQHNALRIVADKTDEITRLIDDIITLQRIDAGNLHLENIAMAELIRTAVAGHRLVASKKGIHVTYSLPESPGIVRIDKGRINQVLDNLIGNAMKFSLNGGIITVSMEEDEDTVSVAVSDEGIGVPKDKQGRIFERFYQIDGSSRRRFGGTGLGLAIVKRIIDAHQGSIWVESELQKGSSFHFVLQKVKSDIAETVQDGVG